MNEIEQLISRYIDNELGAEEQNQLFTILADNPQARKTLHDFMKINMEAASFYSNTNANIPMVFESKIEIKQNPAQSRTSDRSLSRKYFRPVYVNYALGVLILLMAIFSFYQVRSLRIDLKNYQDMYIQSVKQTSEQSEMIKVLLKSLPPIRITPRDYGNIIKTNM